MFRTASEETAAEFHSVIGLSLPEMIILNKVVKFSLILIFVGVVAYGARVVYRGSKRC